MSWPEHERRDDAGGTHGTTESPLSLQRANPTSRPALRTWVVTGVVVIGFSIFALALASYYGATFAVMTLLLAVLVAAIPLGIVIPTFIWLDRFEAEPTRYLVTAFLWGSLVAAVLAALFNTGAVLVFQSATDPTSALSTTAVFVAPPVEESLKGLFVVLIWRLRRQEFDGITDGMVYAGITAAGFAFTENIQYLATAYEQGGNTMLAATFVGRGLLSPFAHPMFTVLIGIGVGIAATSRSSLVRVIALVSGWILAVFAHALWNLSSIAGEAGFVLGYVLVGIPIFLGFVALVVWARRREGRLIGRHLAAYADAGWLSASEVKMLSSMRQRRDARVWARATSGAAGLRSMQAFQDTASELALLRERMRHGTADPGARRTEWRLLQALIARRREFAGAAVI